MTGWRGVVAGALALIFLQTVVGTKEGPGRVSGLIDVASEIAARFIDPSIPAIPDRSQAKPASTTAPPAQPAPYPSPKSPPLVPGNQQQTV